MEHSTGGNVSNPQTATPTDNQNTLGAVAYILTWITGLIIFLVADKAQKEARWHAVQAIGLGIAFVVLSVLFNILGGMAAIGGIGAFGLFALLGFFLWVGTIVLVILLAVKAYKGERLRLPVIADMADKYA